MSDERTILTSKTFFLLSFFPSSLFLSSLLPSLPPPSLPLSFASSLLSFLSSFLFRVLKIKERGIQEQERVQVCELWTIGRALSPLPPLPPRSLPQPLYVDLWLLLRSVLSFPNSQGYDNLSNLKECYRTKRTGTRGGGQRGSVLLVIVWRRRTCPELLKYF